jgi:hypothetical protein
MEMVSGDFENYAYKILIKNPVKKEDVDKLYNTMIKDMNDLWGTPIHSIAMLYGSEEEYNLYRIKPHILFSEYDKLKSRLNNAEHLKKRVSTFLIRVVSLKIFFVKWRKLFLRDYYSPDGGLGFLNGKKSWNKSLKESINS